MCYVVPENSSRQTLIDTHTFDRLVDFITSLDNSVNNELNFVLCGDLNAHTSDLPDFVADDTFHENLLPDDYVTDTVIGRCSQDIGRTNNNGLMLLDLCKQTGMRILNGRFDKDLMGRYTHVGARGSSLVDYVITTQKLLNHVEYFCVGDPNILSDHCIIDFSFTFDKPCMRNNVIDTGNTNCQDTVDSKYVWKNENTQVFHEKLSSDDIIAKLMCFNECALNATSSNDIDNCVTKLSCIIDEVASPDFKYSFEKKNEQFRDLSKQWFNEECFDKRRQFYTMLNINRSNKTEENRINMIAARSLYKNCTRKCRFEHDRLQTIKLKEAKLKNAKLYWKMLKSCAGLPTNNIKSDTFRQYFESVNNPSDPFFTPDEDVLHFMHRYEQNEFNVMFDELNLPIDDASLLKAISELKTNKSGGPDMYINEFFIHGKHVLSPYLLTLFNQIFDIGYFPESWSEGFIVPLHKKGSINEENNYRGITLLSTLGKLFTRILNNRLTEWAEKYSVYIEAQAGFRSNMGTADNMFIVHGILSHMLNQGKQLFCAFIDFTKAFDYVVRDNLWYKLIKLGLRGSILNIIRSMYTSVKSRVKTYCSSTSEQILSNSINCMLGVRQGECLSPFLFSMFLNDIEDEFIHNGLQGIDVNMFKIFLILYADDIVIFAYSSDELQKSLDLLYDYFQRWKLVVNINKTKIMIFRKGGRISQRLNFYYNNSIIEIVNKFSYLGIVFTSGGSFSEAQSTLSGQALKAIFKLNKYLYKFTHISVRDKLDLFDKLVLPILNYGNQIWGFNPGKAIKRIHLQFCKNILGVKKTTSTDFVYGELGRLPLQYHRFYDIIKYWVKLLYQSEQKYTKKVYLLLKSNLDACPNVKNWCSRLRDMLGNLGFYEVWLFQDVGNSKCFLSLVKQRLKDQFLQNWNERISNMSRNYLYTHISCFQFQTYLDILMIDKFRISFTKLRVSSHRLFVEAGRWEKPNSIPLNERLCRNCNILEDEFHFVCECTLYNDLRHTYIPEYYRCRPNMVKFIELLSCENNIILKNLSTFIFKAFQVRNLHHYITE